MSVGDQLIEEPNAVKLEVFKFFKNLYGEDWEKRPFFTTRTLISDEVKEELIMQFSVGKCGMQSSSVMETKHRDLMVSTF